MTVQFAVVVAPLSDAERAELAAIEIAIEDGLRGFAAMGSRLMRVRDGRLYRETHATFEDYCRERWGFRREVADRFIRAAQVKAAAVNPNGLSPQSESVARELAPLRSQPDELREKWSEAVDRHGPSPTAAQVRELVRGPEAPPRKDMRFELIEDAVAMLQDLPDVTAIKWPVDEAGDIDMIDEALSWLDDWLPKARSSWKAHKRALREAGRIRG